MQRKVQNRRSVTRVCKYPALIAVPLCMLFMSLGIGHASAASDGELSIRGVVVDTKDPPTPLAGATVFVKGTNRATITDPSGFFSIQADRNDTLLFNFLGYLPKEFRVNKNEANLSIALAEDVTTIDQIVVTGMTSQQRTQVASSVGVVSSSNFENKPITRLSQALQGGTTGVFVSQESGLPGGDGAKIKIRGVASLLGSDPLVIIDGFESDMDKIDPSTVESISVLKDASAASMYGAKAGNGVIIVTTKRGTAGKVTVGYNGYYGIQQPMYMPDFVDAAQYMEYMNVASNNSGGLDLYLPEEIQITKEGSDPLRYPNTDWMELTMKRFTPIHEHNLNVSGGNTTARFALSAQYLNQKGMYKGHENGFERLAVRLNTTINLTKTLFTYVDAFINRDIQTQPESANQTILDYIYRTPPIVVGKFPRKEDQIGDYIYYGSYKEFANPLLNLERGKKRESFRDYVTLNVRPTWHITPDLILKGQVGYRLSSGLDRVSQKAYEILDYWTGNPLANFNQENTSSYPARSSFWTAGLTLDYMKKFNGGHSLNVIGGWSQEADIRNAWDEVTMVSFFAKAYYSYQEKYLLEVSARYDGSSLFDKGHKWAAFPSAALGWNIDKENFMKPAHFIDAMKLRLSYGMLGNNHVPPYRYQNIVNASGTEIVNGNPDLTWEKVTIWNAGLDMSMFGTKLDFTFDVFRKITTDMFVSIPATPSSAFLSSYVNAGKAEVKGIEVGLGYNHSFNQDVRLSVNVGYSYTKSKLLDIMGDRIVSGDRIYQKGRAITEYYGYVADGFLTQSDLDNYYPIIGGYGVTSTAQGPGDIRYVDINGDGAINDEDKAPIGSMEPESVYYASLSFRYRNLEFETQINGVGYVPVYYTRLISNPLDGDQGGTPQKWHMNYWTEENPDARLPRPTTSAGNNGLFSTFWKANGAYVRVRYIQLGYNMPWLAKKIRASNIRIYANVQNPFTFTGLDLIDPETKGTYSTHPMFKTYSVGLNIQF